MTQVFCKNKISFVETIISLGRKVPSTRLQNELPFHWLFLVSALNQGFSLAPFKNVKSGRQGSPRTEVLVYRTNCHFISLFLTSFALKLAVFLLLIPNKFYRQGKSQKYMFTERIAISQAYSKYLSGNSQKNVLISQKFFEISRKILEIPRIFVLKIS